MGSIYHGNAKTTIKIREEIRDSHESAAKLAKRLSLNIKTVLKWRKAGRVEDAKSGPTKPRSRTLSEQEEQVICRFREVTGFSLDDVFCCLKDRIPTLNRANLYSCLRRNNLNILPKNDDKIRQKKPFKEYEIGYLHIDITELLVGKKKYYMFVGIERLCKYVFVEIYENMTVANSCKFLKNILKDKILTDNGAQFTFNLLAEHLRPKNRAHDFDILCTKYGIEHRLTKFRHPWTNGQVERFNRTIKLYTTKTYHYETIKELKQHVQAFILAYNYQRPLTALKHISPFDKIIQLWDTNKELFKYNPNHKYQQLNSFRWCCSCS